jgi:hypothetical protein
MIAHAWYLRGWEPNMDVREIRVTYPRAWENEYRSTRTVAAWNAQHPEWFPAAPHSTKEGTLDLFPQYALMYLLAEMERVRSVTWLYLAHVDAETLAGVRAGGPWSRPKPLATSGNIERTAQGWVTMRRMMGDADFDALQEAIVRAGFTGFKGEPDLFCYDPATGRWFFAEAKGHDQLGDAQANARGTGWFDIALKTLGEKGRVRVYRVVPE